MYNKMVQISKEGYKKCEVEIIEAIDLFSKYAWLFL